MNKILLKARRAKFQKNDAKWKSQLGYYLMILPPALLITVFSYIPMAGIYMAFIDFKPAKGIFGSDWVGLKWFMDFFTSLDFKRVLRNTILYNVSGILIVSIGCGVLFAVLLYEIRSKTASKIFQTAMLLPAFLSWTVVSVSLYMFLSPDTGVVNQILQSLGMKSISWYKEAEYWPYIITIAKIYKSAGISSIYFYAALLSIDPELFDAARVDGANRLRQIYHISLPAIRNVIALTLILSMGDVLTAGISPFYELTFDQGVLYETTQVIGTYLKNGLGAGRYSYTAAVGVAESFISMILVIVANGIVKKVDPESSLF